MLFSSLRRFLVQVSLLAGYSGVYVYKLAQSYRAPVENLRALSSDPTPQQLSRDKCLTLLKARGRGGGGGGREDG